MRRESFSVVRFFNDSGVSEWREEILIGRNFFFCCVTRWGSDSVRYFVTNRVYLIPPVLYYFSPMINGRFTREFILYLPWFITMVSSKIWDFFFFHEAGERLEDNEFSTLWWIFEETILFYMWLFLVFQLFCLCIMSEDHLFHSVQMPFF